MSTIIRLIPLDRVVYLGSSMRLGLVVARNVAVPTRDDVGGGGRGEAERGRERSTLATKKLFARILIPGGKSNSLPARPPAHSAESRAGLASYVLVMSGGRPSWLGKSTSSCRYR